jgi:hypothetical protein
LELSTSDKPIWVYFDSQHNHILQRVRKVYDIALMKVSGKTIGVSPLVFYLKSVQNVARNNRQKQLNRRE